MVYDPRKIIGITTLAAIRINTLVGRKLAIDPTQVVCPIVGGCCRTSAVPVLSRAAPCPISTVNKTQLTLCLYHYLNYLLFNNMLHVILIPYK